MQCATGPLAAHSITRLAPLCLPQALPSREEPGHLLAGSNEAIMGDWLQQIFWDNTILDWLILLGVILATFLLNGLIGRIIGRILYQFFRRMAPSKGEHFTNTLLRPIQFLMMLVTITLVLQFMTFPSVLNFDLYGVHMSRLMGGIMEFLLVVAVTWLASRVVDFVGEVMADRAALTETTQDDQFVLFIKDVMRVVVYIIAVFLVLGAVLDLNITSLLAGAGLAGLAVALAAQDSLANLFGSLTIFSEKPFLMGDFVETNGILGTVEKVGFRSTRIRTLDKTFVTLPNRLIMENPINNLTDRTFRRVDYTVGLLYGTSVDTIKTIVDRIQAFIDEHPRTNEAGIVAFHAFGASSLDIKVIYFIKEVDWNAYLRIRQEVSLAIMQIVLDHGGDFAFPTTTVHLEQGDSASGEDTPVKRFRKTAQLPEEPSLGEEG